MQDPSSPLATALVLFPLTAPATALQMVSFAASPPWFLVGISLVLLAGAAVLALVLGSRIFRASTLLGGSTPRLRQVLAVLRTG